MDIRAERHGPTLVAMPAGRIDGRNGEDFRDSLMGLLSEADGRLLVDLGRITYLGSIALGALVQAGNVAGARESGFKLCSLPPHLREVFRVSGLDQVVPLADTVDDALADAPESAAATGQIEDVVDDALADTPESAAATGQIDGAVDDALTDTPAADAPAAGAADAPAANE